MINNNSLDQIQILKHFFLIIYNHVINTVFIIVHYGSRIFFETGIDSLLILFVGCEGKPVIVQSHVGWNDETMDLLGNTLHAFVVFQNLVLYVNDVIVLMQFQLEILFSKFIMEVFYNFLGTSEINAFLVVRLESSIYFGNVFRTSVEQIGLAL